MPLQPRLCRWQSFLFYSARHDGYALLEGRWTLQPAFGANQACSHTGAAMVNLQSCAAWRQFTGSSRLVECGSLSARAPLGARVYPFIGNCMACKPDQWRQPCAIASAREELAASVSASCGQHRIYRCAATPASLRPSVHYRIALAAHCCTAAAQARASRTQAPHDVAATPSRRQRHSRIGRCVVGRDGGQQAPEAARDA